MRVKGSLNLAKSLTLGYTGGPPMQVSSIQEVGNLNAGLLEGQHASAFLSGATGTVGLNNLDTQSREVQANFVVPGAFMTGRSATDDLLEKVVKFIFKWELPNATLKSLKAIVLAADTGASQPTINLEINGVAALSSALSLSVSEGSGTINLAADDVVTAQRIELTVVTTGTNSDAQSLTVRTLWEVTG